MKPCFAVYIAGILFFFGIPTVRADDTSENDMARVQAVNQALDKAESKAEARQAPPLYRKKVYPDPLLAQNDELDFSAEHYWSRFNEPKSFSQKGVMSGYHARYTHRFTGDHTSAIMLRVEAEIADGKFKQHPDIGPSGIKDKVYETRAAIGKDYYVTPDLRTTAYSGFGFRYLKDNSEGLNTDLGDDVTLVGFKRFSHYCYIPFGADFLYLPEPNYSWEGNLEYDYLVFGWQMDKLNILPGFDNMVFDQRSGNGVRASLRLNLYFKRFTAFAEGFFRYWNIAASNSKPLAIDPTVFVNEPRNKTEEYGLRIGIDL
jgi:hypothetical protein